MNKGFTLIEILIVIFIIALLAGLGLISYRFFEKKTELEITAQEILAVLESSRTKTLSSEGASQYGVHFESDKYVLFKGSIYNPLASDNEIHQLPSRLEIYDINLTGGGQEVIFERINGTINQNGSLGLRIILEPTKNKTITIDSSGRLELGTGSAGCCETNRLTDTRHIHLDLGWSIQGANTLTLYFSDIPDKTVDINMADYFNIGQTEFDWSGVIDVNGQNQELRIHTHFLDAFDTTLSVHRDRDKNNKPLQVSIDAKDIISYTADGAATIEAFGGTAEVQ